MFDAIRAYFHRLDLTRQFLLVTALILLVGMTVIGNWVGREIRVTSTNRAAAMAAAYVESILVTQVNDWSVARLDETTHAALDRLFMDGALSRKVVRFKLWHADGTIFYSSDHSQTGQRFAIDKSLAAAFRGETLGYVSTLKGADNESERSQWSELLEVYVPVRPPGQTAVVAVAEFYYSMDSIGRDIVAAQQRSWLVVLLGAIAMWLLLHGLVKRAGRTIRDQQQGLRSQLDQLRLALAENERIREHLREAGAATTSLNESFLRRVAAHLHDGPAQDLALALLRFDGITGVCKECGPMRDDRCRDMDTIRTALVTSLDELRSIASGLRMPPGIEQWTLADSARRATQDFERKYGQPVSLEIAPESADQPVPLAVKMTVYRLIQEALNNSWWHAQGSRKLVRAALRDNQVQVEVEDDGPGFDPDLAAASERLGLALLAERVSLLGGSFHVDAAPARGTRVHARIPISIEETVIA